MILNENTWIPYIMNRMSDFNFENYFGVLTTFLSYLNLSLFMIIHIFKKYFFIIYNNRKLVIFIMGTSDFYPPALLKVHKGCIYIRRFKAHILIEPWKFYTTASSHDRDMKNACERHIIAEQANPSWSGKNSSLLPSKVKPNTNYHYRENTKLPSNSVTWRNKLCKFTLSPDIWYI